MVSRFKTSFPLTCRTGVLLFFPGFMSNILMRNRDGLSHFKSEVVKIVTVISSDYICHGIFLVEMSEYQHWFVFHILFFPIVV